MSTTVEPGLGAHLLPDAVQAAQRRVLRVLFVAQIASGAGVAAGVTVGALLAAEMLGSAAAAGLPALLFTLGAGGASIAIGALSDRRGRRVGLVAGYGAGAAGAVGVLGAVAFDSIALLLPAFLVYGAGSAANLQARYAGTDLAPIGGKGRAAGVVLFATTLGAVAAPQVAEFSGGLTTTWALSALAGPFLVAGVAYAIGAVVLAVWLRPDPLTMAKKIATAAVDVPRPNGVEAAGWKRRTRVAVVALFGVQAVMIAIMTMTPVHMAHHGHALQAAATAISIHVAAMYAPAPLSGYLVDRWGAGIVTVLAGVTLAASAGILAVAPGEDAVPIFVGLALLGMGWSFGVAAATHVLSTAPPLSRRVRVQGRADFFVAGAGAAGGGISGVIVSSSSFATLSWIGAAIAGGVALSAFAMKATVESRAVEVPPTPRHGRHGRD